MARTYTNVTSGSALGFKVGAQSTLNTMIANHSGTDGIFYLTQDSHRLYVGTAGGYIVPVNEGIESITSSALSTAVRDWTAADKEAATGSFYYLSDTNTLAVFNGQEWVEINTDSWKDISTQTYSASAANDVATISNTIQVVSQDANDQVPTTDHQVTDSFTITGANGIGVTASGKNVTLTGDTYTLSGAASTTSNAAEIQLNSTNTTNDSKVTLVGGTNTVTDGPDSALTITQNGNTITLRAANEFVTGIALSNESNGFGVQGTRNSGATTTKSTVDPLITVINSSADNSVVSTTHFQNGTAALNVYSKAVIDDMLKGLNAMHYKGTFGSTGGSSGITSISYNSTTGTVTVVPSTATFEVGDTLLYAGANETEYYGSTPYKIGSLLIAQGTEGSDGKITAATLHFDVVQEQFGSDTNYIFSDNGAYGIQLVPSNVTGAGAVGAYNVTPAANGLIDIAVTDATVGGGTSRTLELSHASVTTTASTGNAQTQSFDNTLTIPAVTAVTTDGKGHVSGYTTTSYTLKDTHASVDQTTTAVTTSASNNIGVVTTTVALNHGNNQADSKSVSYEINSNSLSITDGDNATAGRQGLTIDMVWGSF